MTTRSARWVLTDRDAITVWDALVVIQRAREQSDDPETLGRAEVALTDTIDHYRLHRRERSQASQRAEP